MKGLDIMNEVAKRVSDGPQKESKCNCDCEACCKAHEKEESEENESSEE